MEEGEIKKGRLWFHKPKMILKRILNKKFRYKCLECGKGHDGFIAHIEGHGYSNMGDFCSHECFADYVYKYGYSFRQRITDEKDKCIVCGKEHDNQFFNEEQSYSTHAFCSKICLNKSYKTLLPKIRNKKYRDNFKEILDLFKEGKTRKDLKRGNSYYFKSLKIDLNELTA